jgi:hypothetical protein
MYRYARVASILLIAALCAPAAHAAHVTQYGVGLKTCRAYLSARENGDANPDEVAFIDWLSGYFSGINKTSTHRTNALGFAGIGGAMEQLDEYCRARPLTDFAEALSVVSYGAMRGSPSHSVHVTTYGSADKACHLYRAAREQYDVANGAELSEFLDWLGGYISGVNAMSLDTTNVLRGAPLSQAMLWLDSYCSAHPLETFGAAVEALVASKRDTRTAIDTSRSSSGN